MHERETTELSYDLKTITNNSDDKITMYYIKLFQEWCKEVFLKTTTLQKKQKVDVIQKQKIIFEKSKNRTVK